MPMISATKGPASVGIWRDKLDGRLCMAKDVISWRGRIPVVLKLTPMLLVEVIANTRGFVTEEENPVQAKNADPTAGWAVTVTVVPLSKTVWLGTQVIDPVVG